MLNCSRANTSEAGDSLADQLMSLFAETTTIAELQRVLSTGTIAARVPPRTTMTLSWTDCNKSTKKWLDVGSLIRLATQCLVPFVNSPRQRNTPSAVLACTLPMFELWQRHASCSRAPMAGNEKWTRLGVHFRTTEGKFSRFPVWQNSESWCMSIRRVLSLTMDSTTLCCSNPLTSHARCMSSPNGGRAHSRYLVAPTQSEEKPQKAAKE